ncbi:enolase C-terminal domain-like protein [Gordonia sp. SL306]|uniref:enolase C-terminal domain-like protein n=1 Tax=Gordonia sp. SL306 TaxID=2995145 RepID=UPI0022714315|nr:enolase C-terminal domain-like protein [Gordonia sp. SL306]WAC57923.1 mandelate racemase [Gordonia sp. SL306]
MRIVEIREVAVPLEGSVANAVVSFNRHTVSLVAVITDVMRHGVPVYGVAFNSIGRFAQSGLLRDRMIPRVLDAPPDELLDPDTGILDPERVLRSALVDEKPGGHGDRACAAAAIELACWDLLGKLADEPAYATIARADGRTPTRRAAPVYAAGGYYRPGDDIAQLREEISGYLESGYRAVKIKVGGLSLDDDLRRVDEVVSIVGSGGAVAVDANGRFGREMALTYAKALEPYQLRWFEEPVDPLDYGATADLTATYDGVLATGENLFSRQDVANLLRFGGIRPNCDILQMDAGLSYGLTEYRAMLDLMESAGVGRAHAVPHGGHLINLHIVGGLGLGGCEAYPGVFQPFGGYSNGCAIEDGTVTPAEYPGFGLEAKTELAGLITRLVG